MMLLPSCSRQLAGVETDRVVYPPSYTVWTGDRIRAAQPCRTPGCVREALSEGMERTPEWWFEYIYDNWLLKTQSGVMDGDFNRDGVVNLKDFAVVSRHWKK